jgi:antitoxin component of MazEF toxin-antitoxin module
MELNLGSRKVQRMGKRGAFFVTLPLPWLNTCKISKGDAVNVSMGSDGALRILPGVVA